MTSLGRAVVFCAKLINLIKPEIPQKIMHVAFFQVLVGKLKKSNILTDTMNQETVSVSTCDFHRNKNLKSNIHGVQESETL